MSCCANRVCSPGPASPRRTRWCSRSSCSSATRCSGSWRRPSGTVVNLAAEVLGADAVRLGRAAADKRDAIDQCGRLLVEIGAVEEPYRAAMHEREESMPTYIGEGVAIPHGT